MGLYFVGNFAAPADVGKGVEHGRLHLLLLVGMGEQIEWDWDRAIQILIAGGGLRQRAGVENGRQLASVEQFLQVGEFGMEGKRRTEALRLNWKQRAARQRQSGANLRVVVIIGGAIGHNHVVGVVPAEHEYAHQSLVVRSALSIRADQTEPVEAGRSDRGCGSTASGSEKAAPCESRHIPSES
jgi:hypothetical protein